MEFPPNHPILLRSASGALSERSELFQRRGEHSHSFPGPPLVQRWELQWISGNVRASLYIAPYDPSTPKTAGSWSWMSCESVHEPINSVVDASVWRHREGQTWGGRAEKVQSRPHRSERSSSSLRGDSWSRWYDRHVLALTRLLAAPNCGGRCLSFGFICWHVLPASHARTALKTTPQAEPRGYVCPLLAVFQTDGIVPPHEDTQTLLSSLKTVVFHLDPIKWRMRRCVSLHSERSRLKSETFSPTRDTARVATSVCWWFCFEGDWNTTISIYPWYPWNSEQTWNFTGWNMALIFT